MSKTLVIGASGTVGSELSQLLAKRGHQVLRATSRAPAAADQRVLNLYSGEGVAQALEGVDRLFLLAPPGYTQHDKLLGPLIEQARARQLRKVVLMSAMGANADPSAPLRKAELQLEAAGLAFNIIRPNWFMQNFNTFWLHGIVNQGKIFLPVGQAKGSFIDSRDIAAVAATLLDSHEHDGKDFDLTGSRALDHDEVAAILSRASGREIGFQDITPEAMLAGLLGAGLPADYAQFLVTLLGYFKAGYAQQVTDAVQRITGRAPRSIEAYAQDYRSAWA